MSASEILSPNGTSPVQYELHLAKRVLLFTQSTHRYSHLFRTQSVLSVQHYVNICKSANGCLGLRLLDNGVNAPKGARDLGLVSLHISIYKKLHLKSRQNQKITEICLLNTCNQIEFFLCIFIINSFIFKN